MNTKKLIIKFFLPIVALCVFSYISILLYSLNKYDIEEIIICSLDSGSHYIPPNVCEYYLYNFRADKKDITDLSEVSNLGFMVGIENKSKREKLLNFFISKGSDINGISNIDGLTPLHAAILINDEDLVKYLIEKGANPLKMDRDNKLTAIEYVELLIKKAPDVSRKNILIILQNQ